MSSGSVLARNPLGWPNLAAPRLGNVGPPQRRSRSVTPISANPAQAPLFTLEATSFQARPGEIVAILGPNASGKSTLLKLISGALAPLSGRILLNGFVTHELTPRTRAQRIAVVQQESTLLFPARAWEFVLQGRHSHGRSLRFETEDDIAIAKNALALGRRRGPERPLDGSNFRRRKAARDRPRARFGPTAASSLLDEAHSPPGYRRADRLARFLAPRLADNRYTVVVVTHELNLAAEYADQIVLMQRAAACACVGSPASIYQRELLEQVFPDPAHGREFGSNGRPRVNRFAPANAVEKCRGEL